MNTLASGLSFVDLQWLGVPRVIATVVLHGAGRVALIDPGPASTLPTLEAALGRAGIALGDVTDVLLTHIHLDHAGACGTLAARNPALRVHVHDKGAPHLVAPEKLLASAARLWGDEMDRLWGEMRPVPLASIVVLHGGERFTAAGRTLDVAYTPGHASHHVSYYNADTGIAFVGDTAGVRVVEGGYVLPPTPPPDIDLEAWRASLTRIDAWHPEVLFLTHFGPSAPPAPHLRSVADHLDGMSRLVRASLERDDSDESRERWFMEEIRRDLRRRMSEADAQAYEAAGRFDLSWRGLARYWRKRSQAPAV